MLVIKATSHQQTEIVSGSEKRPVRGWGMVLTERTPNLKETKLIKDVQLDMIISLS